MLIHEKRLKKFVPFILIIAYTIILYIMCISNKYMRINDEMLYYGIARNIYNGNGIIFRGANFPIQNLGYILYLVPFFAIKNAQSRISMIILGDCFLYSLIPLFGWKICDELQMKKRYKIAVAVILLSWPEVTTAGTLMSENLYHIVFVITIYFVVKQLQERKIANGILLGGLFYLNYFIKEVGICLILAYLGYTFLEILVLLLKDGEKSAVKDKVKNISLIAGVFAFLYIVINNVLLRNASNLYTTKMGIEFINDAYCVSYFIYAFIYYIVASCIAFLVFPIIIPLVMRKELDYKYKFLFNFALSYLLGVIFVIVYTISVKEDMGRIIPRIHLRYYAPIGIVFMILLFRTLEFFEDNSQKLQIYKNKIVGMVAIFGVISISIFKGVYTPGGINENPSLRYTLYIKGLFNELKNVGNVNSVTFYPYAIVENLLIIIFCALFFLLLYKNKKKSLYGIIILFSCINIINDVYQVNDIKKLYNAEQEVIDSVQNINDYFNDSNRNDKIMLISTEIRLKNPEIFDMYFDVGNYSQVNYSVFLDKILDKDMVDVKSLDFKETIYQISYNWEKIDYFILDNASVNIEEVLGNIERIDEISDEYFSVYRNLSSDKIVNKKKNLLTLDFSENGYDNAINYITCGLSMCEGEYTWTDGNDVNICADLENANKPVSVSIILAGIMESKQRIIIRQDDQTILFDKEINLNDQDINFKIEPISGTCNFTLELPDACSPNSIGVSSDTRKLALRLKRIYFSQDNI